MNLQDSKELFITLRLKDISKKGKWIEVEIDSSNELLRGESRKLWIGDELRTSLNFNVDMDY